MNAELQKCRQHYHKLPMRIKLGPAGKSFLSAIQIADDYETLLLELAACAQSFRDRVTTGGIELHRLDAALERVAKPEGK